MVCAQTYDATYGEQRTCGRACGWELRQREGKVRVPKPRVELLPSCRIYIQHCEVCGVLATFRQRRSSWVCSKTCANRRYNALRPRKNPGPSPCVTCGSGSFPFPPRNCRDCKRHAKRAAKRRRAAIKAGVPTEPYTLALIAARDHGRCGLCGKRVAMDRVAPHPDAPTIDHVVPIADGGDDTRANVQLAHFICNSRKGAGGSQQLALIG